MDTPALEYTVRDHFLNREPCVKATYEAILKIVKRFGPVKEEAKKTSIHLVRKTAFAGVATRKSSLILTIKSESDIRNKRISKREQVSRSRWHLEVKLDSADSVDSVISAWLKHSYELSA